jgi:hypothetical protein
MRIVGIEEHVNRAGTKEVIPWLPEAIRTAPTRIGPWPADFLTRCRLPLRARIQVWCSPSTPARTKPGQVKVKEWMICCGH